VFFPGNPPNLVTEISKKPVRVDLFGYLNTPNINIYIYLGKINLISLIVVKSIKALTITEHIVLQDHSRN
jgi:hypothetical protein